MRGGRRGAHSGCVQSAWCHPSPHRVGSLKVRLFPLGCRIVGVCVPEEEGAEARRFEGGVEEREKVWNR